MDGLRGTIKALLEESEIIPEDAEPRKAPRKVVKRPRSREAIAQGAESITGILGALSMLPCIVGTYHFLHAYLGSSLLAILAEITIGGYLLAYSTGLAQEFSRRVLDTRLGYLFLVVERWAGWAGTGVCVGYGCWLVPASYVWVQKTIALGMLGLGLLVLGSISGEKNPDGTPKRSGKGVVAAVTLLVFGSALVVHYNLQ